MFLGRDPVTGTKRYATKTVRGGKREAQSALAAMITEAERGSPDDLWARLLDQPPPSQEPTDNDS